MMKRIFIAVFSLAILSCSKSEYTLDYRHIRMSDVEMNGDSLMQRQQYLHEVSDSGGLSCTTKLEEYMVGEPVVLTIKNSSNKVYDFYTPEKPIDDGVFPKSLIDQILVSKKPAITGAIMHFSPDHYVMFILSPSTQAMSKYGYTAWKMTLEPQEQAVFRIQMPSVTGSFQFEVSYQNNKRSENLYSNVFTITDKK